MEINAGDTAWVLASAALVMLMTPGLAFFYGGMVRVKSVLNMMMMSAITIAVVTILWVLVGYSLTFGGDTGHVIGNFSEVGLRGLIAPDAVSGTIPTLAFVAFQLMFAIITPALISGAIADRATFRGWIAFVVGWTCLVYFPVAHSVWFLDDGNGGWIGDKLGAIDFAGGTAVHVNAGAAALALAIVLGKRIGWKKDPMRPHSLPLVDPRRRSAVVRLVRLQRGLRAERRHHRRGHLRQHPGRHRRRRDRLADRGADPARQGHHAGHGLRRGRRSGRDHPGLWRGHPGRRDHPRRSSPV